MRFLLLSALVLFSMTSFAGELTFSTPAGVKIDSIVATYGSDPTALCRNLSVRKGKVQHSESGDVAKIKYKSKVEAGLCSRWLDGVTVMIKRDEQSYWLTLPAEPSDLSTGSVPTILENGEMTCQTNQYRQSYCLLNGEAANLKLWSNEISKINISSVR